jgi:hypothetical protein
MYVINKVVPLLLLVGLSGAAIAKLPAPNEEAMAKAAEVTAKAAWTGKVNAHLLCKSQDRAAASYYKSAAASGKPTKPATTTAPCADPGVFVYMAAAPVLAKPIEAAGAHSPTPTAASPPNGKQTDAVVNPAKKS